MTPAASEYFGDYNELLYLRARYYAPGMGRFLTRDTWDGDINQPMSYNAWNYVNSNPINLVDPSGMVPCAENQSPRICLLNRGGYIDVVHFRAKKHTVNWLINEELPKNYGKDLGQVTIIGGLGDAVPIPFFRTYYTRLPKAGISEIAGVAVGMIFDYDYGFEVAQGIDPRCFLSTHKFGHCSSFSNEDLPSNYLGTVAAVKNISLETIVSILGGGEQKLKDHDLPPDEYWGKPFDPFLCSIGLCGSDTPFNNQWGCTFKIYDELWGRYRNLSWPSSLIVKPYGYRVYWGKNISDLVSFPQPIWR